MKLYKDILLLLTLTGLLWSAVGCSGVIYDNYSTENDPEDPNLVTLVLNVGLVAPTRAALPDQEMMHDLRIVLLDADGKVEYNELIGFDSGAQEYKEGVQGYQFIRTKPGEKKIFFVANEASVTAVHSTDNSFTDSPSLTAVLNQWPAGSTNGESKKFENMVKSIYFSSDYRGNIPLSSSYAFTITDADLGERVVKEFYLVHAATKFEFEFINNRLSPVQIDALSISSIADNMYLMANFGTTPAEKKEFTWEEGGSMQTAYWIDWLKKVSDETTDNPDNPENESINARYGWLTDYTIPQTAAYKDLNVKDAIGGNNWIINQYADNAEPWTLPPVYCSESRYMNGNAQNYTLTITLSDDGEARTFTENLELPALFRNTSVRVKIALYGYNQLQVFVMLTAWDEQTSGDITFN